MNSAAFTKTYEGRRVLTMPEHEWRPGTIYAVIGGNGSGKSTLAKALSGTEATDGKNALLPRVSVGYLPQKPYAFRMRVEKNLLLNGADIAKANALMESLGLSELRRKRAKHLSGGETAKMALARLLMREYDLLILDEPTAALDMASTLAAEKLLQDCREQTGCAMILVTHSLRQARRVAGRALYLEDGALIEEGDTAQLLSAPKETATKRFLDFYC